MRSVLRSHEFWWDSHPDLYQQWWHRARERFQDEDVNLFGTNDHLFGTAGGVFRGVTTNPMLIRAAMDPAMVQLTDPAVHSSSAFWSNYQISIARAAAYGQGLWHRSGGRAGWVCAQVDPGADTDSIAMLDHARELARLSPNIMVKVPASKAGFEVLANLVEQGISVNMTAAYSVAQAHQFCRSVQLGLRRRPPVSTPTRYLLTIMLGRISNDDEIDQAVPGVAYDPTHYLRWMEIEVARSAKRVLDASRLPVGMLFSSVKLDDERGVPPLHLTHIPEDTVLTMHPDTVSKALAGSHFGRAKSTATAPRDIESWYTGSKATRRLLSPSIAAEEFETWPQYLSTLGPARAATSAFVLSETMGNRT